MPSQEAALQRAVIAFVRSFGLLQTESTPCGLNVHVSDAHALGDIAEHGPLTQNALATRLHLQKSTVSRLVAQLTDRGWVERFPDPNDGRAQLVSLTSEGRDVARRLNNARVRRFATLLAAVPANQRACVVKATTLLASAAQSNDYDAP
jgi:DNA-binding MarR family transcriptional regulator